MSAPVRLEREPDVAAIVTPVMLTFEGLRVVERDERMDGPIGETGVRLRTASHLEPMIAAVRSMYRALGIDPDRPVDG